ncbi:olfactory receptor 14A16-like [Chlamydotis macqueenii]
MGNDSSITEFLLLAFTDKRELQLLHFWLFLGIYLAALLANGLIITAIACDHHLHTPMYFFLLNLSTLDLGCISTTVPKSMANSLWNTSAISYSGCAAQVFFFFFLMSAEYWLLTVMAYDRYAAICRPLHYGTLLGSRACVHMAAAAWGSGFLYAVLHTANTFSLALCKGKALNQFFCEIPEILKLSCSDAYLREVGLIVISAFVFVACFVFIVVSYVQIFRAVLRIPSEQGRHKAFSTCLPHLTVVSLFISTGMFACLKPPSISSPSLNLLVAALYSLVPPAVNPLIYSMRNQELKEAVWNLMTECFPDVSIFNRLGIGCSDLEEQLGLQGYCCLDFSKNATSALEKVCAYAHSACFRYCYGLYTALLMESLGPDVTALNMVLTRKRASPKETVATQTEGLPKNAAVQVSGCRECLSLLLPGEDGKDAACARCEQLYELLSLVVKLREDAERLRSIRECKREIDILCEKDAEIALPGPREYWTLSLVIVKQRGTA